MSVENTSEETVDVEKTDTDDIGVSEFTELVKGMQEGIEKISEEVKTVKSDLEEAKKPVYPNGMPFTKGFNIREGEDALTSRPYMLSHVLRRQAMQKGWIAGDYRNVAKPEVELAEDLRKHYATKIGSNIVGFPVPIGADYLPMDEYENEEGATIRAVPAELRKRCKDMMQLNQEPDLDAIVYMAKQHNLPLNRTIRKDMSANIADTGGTLVAAMAQGELINVLRASEVFSQIGAQDVDIPPQGSIRMPRITTAVTFAAATEGSTITENTPATGHVVLQAKPYASLVDIPEELLLFSSVNIEAWLRSEFAREGALKVDRDRINGSGGTAIQGVINFSGVQTRTAGTTAANGDTLDSPDPLLLHGDLVDNNVPDDGTFFFALTGSLWAGLITRQATTNEFIAMATAAAIGGGTVQKSIGGFPAICTTQVPTDRAKGTATNLTLLLAGVGSEYMIGRAGVIDVQLTDSDASKFASRISTMRATMYSDGAPVHEESFGFIDDVTNS